MSDLWGYWKAIAALEKISCLSEAVLMTLLEAFVELYLVFYIFGWWSFPNFWKKKIFNCSVAFRHCFFRNIVRVIHSMKTLNLSGTARPFERPLQSPKMCFTMPILTSFWMLLRNFSSVIYTFERWSFHNFPANILQRYGRTPFILLNAVNIEIVFNFLSTELNLWLRGRS